LILSVWIAFSPGVLEDYPGAAPGVEPAPGILVIFPAAISTQSLHLPAAALGFQPA
jgi:hypothetical protein